jgi:phage portal protein BeeE
MGIFDKLFKRRYTSWKAYDTFMGAETSSGQRVSDERVLGIPAVFACVRVLAESISSMPLITYRRLANGDRETSARLQPLSGIA